MNMNKLLQLRTIIASLDETLVGAFCTRAQFKINADLYHDTEPVRTDIIETARQFSDAVTVAGRSHLLRPLYIHTLLPGLCAPGSDTDRRKCLSADNTCMNALVQRLNLSVHVAALKLEELPDTLRIALDSGDPVKVEAAITNAVVETEVLVRIRNRADSLHCPPELAGKIVSLYQSRIIPLSRKIQVHDLLKN